MNVLEKIQHYQTIVTQPESPGSQRNGLASGDRDPMNSPEDIFSAPHDEVAKVSTRSIWARNELALDRSGASDNTPAITAALQGVSGVPEIQKKRGTCNM
jgi:hypothetical protein